MSPELVKPETLLYALGVVAEAERDAHLGERLRRLARKISSHFERCKRCQAAIRTVPRSMSFALLPDRTAFCADGLRLVTALGRAAASGQRDGVSDVL